MCIRGMGCHAVGCRQAASMTTAMALVNEMPPLMTHKKAGDLAMMELPLMEFAPKMKMFKQAPFPNPHETVRLAHRASWQKQ